MKTALLFRTACLGLMALAACAAPEGEMAAKRFPNFVLIFCDDLGYGDIGCFGSKKHRTPNVDRMAAEGMKLTSFYSTSGVCTPSRSSLMTGCYPRRVDMHQSGRNEWVLFPVAREGLHPGEATVAEVLKQNGYATACIGKWHLGDQHAFLPTKQGFDRYFGIPYSNDMGVRQRPKINPPLPLMRNETVIEAPVDQTTVTKRYTEEAVRFIGDHRDRPFLLYLPHTMPHNPVHSGPDFQGKSSNGGFGDCVEEIDWSTGEILDALKEHGLDRNTLVIFTSDNGAAKRWGGSNEPLSGWKGSTMEGGMRVCFVARWPGTIPAGSVCDEVTSTIDILPTFAAIAGAPLPKMRVLDGRNILPLLEGRPGAASPHEAYFYYRVRDLQAVRSGKWKLHLKGNKLYDLKADIGETNDVASENEEVVRKLLAHAEDARRRLGDGSRQGAEQRKAGFVDAPTPRLK